MPTVPLPAEPSLEQLRKFAKDIRDAVRSGNPRAIAFVAEHHPLGAPDDASIPSYPLSATQLAVARRHGFPSWPRLKHHLDLVADLSRAPDRIDQSDDRAAELLRLGCLDYGTDDPTRWAAARQMLTTDPSLGRATIHTAAACNDADAVRDFVARDRSSAVVEGGPHRWTPLMYLAYSRIAAEPSDDAVLATALALLDAGADPNAGYLWHGLPTPFTVLTGAFGGGELGVERQPPHPSSLPLARLLLEHGADANDGQALYNRMFEPNDDHLELLFEFGLGRGDGGPWKRRLGPALDSPSEMMAAQLRWAISHDMVARVELLAVHDVDLAMRDDDGRTPTDLAALHDRPRVLDVLLAHGAPPPVLAPADALVAALLAGDTGRIERIEAEHSGVLDTARTRRPGLVVWAAASGHHASIPLLVARGFDVNQRARMDVPVEQEWETALHVAVERDEIELAQLLLDLGADPNARDARYDATPLGWAEHFDRPRLAELLRPLTS